MAAALVQNPTALHPLSSLTWSPTWSQNTAAGNLLIAIIQNGSTTAPTSTSTGWTQAVISASSPQITIFYRANSTAAEAAPTFQFVSTQSGYVQLFEFSGCATASPLDRSATSSSATSPLTLTAAGTDAESGQLVVGGMSDSASKSASVTLAQSLNNGGALTVTFEDSASSGTSIHTQLGYLLATTSNASADVMTDSSSSMNLNSPLGLVGAFASFKLGAAAFQPRPPAINFQDPGLLMEKLGAKWEKTRERIWLPNFSPVPA